MFESKTRYVVSPGLHIVINSCPGSSMMCVRTGCKLNSICMQATIVLFCTNTMSLVLVQIGDDATV